MCDYNTEMFIKARNWMHSLGNTFKSISPKVYFNTGAMTNIDCFVKYEDITIRFNINELNHNKLTAETKINGKKERAKTLINSVNINTLDEFVADYLKDYASNQFNIVY